MASIVEVLADAQRLGHLGPGDVRDHLVHARGFLDLLGASPRRVADLGSGGGVPALALAVELPTTELTLVEGSVVRAAFLAEAIERLGVAGRVSVAAERAELLGHRPEHRHGYDAVTARSFGPPAVVAECGAPLLDLGGRLVVSEPPSGVDRWPEGPLHELGLAVLDRSLTPAMVVLVARGRCSPRYPRRTGVPAKRPLF